jgi:hypothetical protein
LVNSGNHQHHEFHGVLLLGCLYLSTFETGPNRQATGDYY